MRLRISQKNPISGLLAIKLSEINNGSEFFQFSQIKIFEIRISIGSLVDIIKPNFVY